MGASLNQRRNKGHYGRRRSSAQMSEINVTPMVDVMLVLLVIFMVTAPLLTVGVEVDLPKTKAGEIQGQDEPLAVSIDKDGNYFVQDTQVELTGLAPLLLEISKNNQDVRIFVRGDENIDYGTVMRVMGVLNQAGFTKVALIARNPDTSKKK
ncbi:Biopolymer transport protein ExbD [Candidatus Terasakiella magnetica]|uniref:Biopolymer transport protein ExbD n=1 Tax=Candidatus Terasakiella magnetica TaxID=1867952 RepID=A0A1C3RHP7_9PROT|nr:protein TolR [Candidatus Terasakiella magnetica]SCA56800.1 Biopolymer transport protein ExbD [Candidatus Terasakiella magnetica]